MVKTLEFAAELLLIKAGLDKARAYYLKDNDAMCIAELKVAQRSLDELMVNIISPGNKLFIAK